MRPHDPGTARVDSHTQAAAPTRDTTNGTRTGGVNGTSTLSTARDRLCGSRAGQVAPVSQYTWMDASVSSTPLTIAAALLRHIGPPRNGTRRREEGATPAGVPDRGAGH